MIAINTNITALSVYNQSRLNQLDFNEKVERLTNGVRVNRGADDPSGLGIAIGMRGQIEGLATATLNIQDGINMIHYLDGAFEVGNDITMRIRDLGVRIANVATLDIDSLNESSDVNRLRAEMNSLARLLKKFYSSEYPEGIPNPVPPGFTGTSKPFIQYNGKPILMNGTYQIKDAGGNIIYEEVQWHLTNPRGEDIQVGPNSGSEFAVNIHVDDIEADVKDLHDILNVTMKDVETWRAGAWNDFGRVTIDAADELLEKFANIRAQLGVQERSLKTTLGDIQAEYINVSAGRSRIMDADMAVEIAAFTKGQIKEQTTTAIASQANAAPLITMKLIGAIYDGLAPATAMNTS